MMNLTFQKWLKVTFLNLLIVSILGCILRYKFAYSLPVVNMSFLLHGHSHFAFSGWVSQALMILMVQYLSEKTSRNEFPRYRWILWGNLVSAYGMLFSFPFEGYATISIIFSTGSVFAGYGFAIYFWKDLNRLQGSGPERPFFKAALFFNALSSFGPYGLAYFMAHGNSHPRWIEACVYFFLHFQYNGWFLFGCMGLFASRMPKLERVERRFQLAHYLFAFSCVPAYLLSILWAPLPTWLYGLAILSGLAQLLAWGLMAGVSRKTGYMVQPPLSSFARILLILCAIAYTIKLSLQAASSLPSLSHLTFGFRPIIIGYLHLVLLVVVSLFIISYCIAGGYYPASGYRKKGVVIFVSGIILNEILLMIEGIADLDYHSVPYMNDYLLWAAVIIFLGLVLMNLNWKNPAGSGEILAAT